MKNTKVLIGLIGLGYWGQNLLRNLCQLEVLHTACDTDENILKVKQKEFPQVQYTTSAYEVLNCPEIGAVAIATPATTHFDLAKRGILAGKDIFLEKPLALTVKQGEELAALARKKGRILMVGHVLQFHPAVIELKRLIADGKLGRIRYIYSNRLNIGKLRTEENILWSFAPHDISVVLSMVGDDPIVVSAFGGDYLSPGINDVTLTTLEFRNGVKGHVFVSWLHPFKEQKLVVVGSEAMAVFNDVSNDKLLLYPHTIEWKDGKIPIAHKADFQVVPIDAAEPLRLELEHFIQCIQKRTQPKTDAEEGLRVLRVLEQAEKSLVEKKKMLLQPLGPVDYYAHETACIDEGVHIGKGTKIWHFSHVLPGSKIGSNCIIGQNVVIGPDVQLGNKCKVQNNVSIYKGITLEDEVFCGPACVFTNVYNPRAFIERKDEFRPTLIKRGATIGANSTIVCGITVGRYALIGAGAVVKKDVPDFGIAAGVPAKLKGWACRCGLTLPLPKKNVSVCSGCKTKYKVLKSQCVEL